MTDQTTPATVRIRVNHTHTQKNGWQHETTVEISGALGTIDRGMRNDDFMVGQGFAVGDDEAVVQFILPDTLRSLLTQVDTIGREESARRNALDQEAA